MLNPIAVGVRREHHDWSVAHAQPPTTSRYELWVVSNRPYTVRGRVELRFLSVNTGRDILTPIINDDIVIAANSTTDLITNGLIDYVAEPEPHILAARLWVENRIVARDVDWPQPFKYLNLSSPGLVVHKDTASGEEIRLTITTRNPVKCLVFEEQEGVKISDNAMDIVPGDEQTILVSGLQPGQRLWYRHLGQEKPEEVDI